MSSLRLSHPSKKIKATIPLGGSKSISNRVLLIKAFSGHDIHIDNLSSSDDTSTLVKMLDREHTHYDTGHAGTTFRFMTAYLAFKEGTHFLTGSERMQQRPVKALVEALNGIGANIEYENEIGYPPLIINSPKNEIKGEINIDAGISSQYISALMMLAPTLPQGLIINLTGEMVSLPYIKMTASILEYFDIRCDFVDHKITIEKQAFSKKDFFVESDWSAASYYFAMASMAKEAEITLTGLFKDSLQGDAAIVKIAEKFGIVTTYGDKTITLKKNNEQKNAELIEYDFIEQPDIAQTIFAMCAANNIKGLFTGLQTLYIKETDRIQAFKNELAKIDVQLSKLPLKFSKDQSKTYYLVEGQMNTGSNPIFNTYHDHRMAMALAPLALKSEITINEYEVVSKSYPEFWNHLKKCNFEFIIL